MIDYAPGMRTIIRDEEWMIKKTEKNSLGNQALYCIGISPLVKDIEAVFLTDLEAIKIVNPRIIISLGATALNQFIPNSNLLEYVHTKQVFNGIPTLIDYSVKDLFDLTPYKSEEEIDEISYGILNTFNEAARYIKALRGDLYDNKNTR